MHDNIFDHLKEDKTLIRKEENNLRLLMSIF